MPEFDRDKFYNVSRTMAAADKLLPADEQPERCQGLPLRDALADALTTPYTGPHTNGHGYRLHQADAALAVIRTRIEALPTLEQVPLDGKVVAGNLLTKEAVRALLEGQEHASRVGKPMEEGSR